MPKRRIDHEIGEPVLTHREKMIVETYIVGGWVGQSPLQTASALDWLQGSTQAPADLRLTGP
jgi:hypothetical protein